MSFFATCKAIPFIERVSAAGKRSWVRTGSPELSPAEPALSLSKGTAENIPGHLPGHLHRVCEIPCGSHADSEALIVGHHYGPAEAVALAQCMSFYGTGDFAFIDRTFPVSCRARG